MTTPPEPTEPLPPPTPGPDLRCASQALLHRVDALEAENRKLRRQGIGADGGDGGPAGTRRRAGRDRRATRHAGVRARRRRGPRVPPARRRAAGCGGPGAPTSRARSAWCCRIIGADQHQAESAR